MSNSNLIKIINLTFVTLFFILIIRYFYFDIPDYPNHDELVSISFYLHPELIFLKNFPNNHVFLTLLGFLVEKILGTSLFAFRMISFISFIFIFLLFNNYFKNLLFNVFFLSIYVFSEYLVNYSFLFRGYLISALMFVILFKLISEHINKYSKKNLLFIYGIISLLFLTIISNLYLILPILLVIFIIDIKRKKNNFLFFINYFVIPNFFIQTLVILFTGLIWLKIFYFDLEYIYKNFYLIFTTGIDRIYFNEAIINLYPDYLDFFNLILKDKIIFLILLTTLLINFYKIFSKKFDYMDCIIIFFFIFFLILNKFSVIRIFIPFLFFFIFYIFNNFRNKFYTSNYFHVISLFFLIFLFYKFDFFKRIETYQKEINLYESDISLCALNRNNLSEIEKHMYYYTFLQKCQKRNLKLFYNFYKN